jgi:hypothetical protein
MPPTDNAPYAQKTRIPQQLLSSDSPHDHGGITITIQRNRQVGAGVDASSVLFAPYPDAQHVPQALQPEA